ncbi:MAG TPA: ATP-dependent Clp protease proteolytic subunit [Spirochaetota bacterium]|nr:ATP-dependent Clp protease proteolytic subunit [Spirochaetota bacterium]
MSLINDYITKIRNGWGPLQLEDELQKLISVYNKHRNTYLIIYSAAMQKNIPEISLNQDDFYTIVDLLSEKKGSNSIDFYVETPGGSGVAAEEIARFLHNNFNVVTFIIAGEAKSAGTILALSGHEIFMSETGSLGPIDAQVKIGRSVISASDYCEWINEKRKEADKNKRLNPFDATMVAQISPGELESVRHALQFAIDRVAEWIKNYKFKDWSITETRKIEVTDKMKADRAREIAENLAKHSNWQSHGRSIKIEDLSNWLKINKVEDDHVISDTISRIKIVSTLLFQTTSTFKMFVTENYKIFRQATPRPQPLTLPQKNQQISSFEAIQKCPNCGHEHKLYGKFIHDPIIDKEEKGKGFMPIPKSFKLNCDCGQEIDLTGIKNDIEMKTGRQIIN